MELLRDSSKGSLSDQAYHFIKQEISNGNFKPGDELTEGRLASLLGISRTPLREAFNRLQAENLLDVIPNKGCIVKKLEIRDVLEIMQVRGALEGMAARIACQKIRPEEVDMLISWFPEIRNGVLEEDQYEMAFNAGNQLHAFLIEKCGNQLLKKQLSFINIQVEKLVRMITGLPERHTNAYFEHMAIIEGLRQADCDLAECNMRIHIRKIRDSVIRMQM